MAAKLELFTLKTIHKLSEGELEQAFDEQLKAFVQDAIKRPQIEKVRKLTLTVEIRPAAKTDGTCDDVFVDCYTASKCPTRPVQTYRMRSTVNGGLKFQPDAPLEPDQGTLDFEG